MSDTAEGAPRDAPAPVVPRAHHAVWWKLAIGVVFAVLGTVLLVKVIGGSSGPRTTTDLSQTSATVLGEVTRIPASIYNAVGVRSAIVPVQPPALLRGARLLAVHVSGKTVPVVLFVGAEYNAFSAAERWPLIAALSRFGTFRSLYDVESSSIDFAPNTPTFSFFDVNYRSADLVFRPYEVATDVLGRSGYRLLMHPPGSVVAEERRLDPSGTLPFVDVANLAVARAVALSPVTFVGLSRDQVASGLSNPTNPVTKSIVASANYLTAVICAADGGHPGRVCGSRGVRAADAALGIATR